MSLPRNRKHWLLSSLIGLLLLQAGGKTLAANGDLLATSTALSGKEITGLCADSDGTFWALGELTGKIYHLNAALEKIDEIPNPHGTGTFPNFILSRGIAFRPSSQTLLVLARNPLSKNHEVKELDRTGTEIPAGNFTIDTSSIPNANLSGLAYDALNDQFWVVDDTRDLIVHLNSQGIPMKSFSYPGDTPPETTLRGSGISFLYEGITPSIWITYGDIFTLAPSRVLQLRLNCIPTGIEVSLENVPPPEPGAYRQKIGALLVRTFNGTEAAFVVAEKGIIHVLDRTKPIPVPPSFFRARLTMENKVVLSWENHGSGPGESYLGGIIISRDGIPIASIGGGKEEFVDGSPPATGGHVIYTIKGSDGQAFSISVKVEVVVGKGGLIRWIPFPGVHPFDAAWVPSKNEIFVTDVSLEKIFRFDKALNYLGEIPSPVSKPGGIAFNPNGNGGAGSLMVAGSEGVLMQEIDFLGKTLDARVPVNFGLDAPRVAGLVYNPSSQLYTCVETSTKKLFSYDRNGIVSTSCMPPDFLTAKLSEGLGLDLLTGNFHATFEGGWVRELYSECTPTIFNFNLWSLGESSTLPNFVRGIEVIDNTLLVCGSGVNALFQVLIFPQGQTFIRGDLDQDGKVLINDAMIIAEYLFQAGPTPFCLDAADSNDDGEVDISDPVYLLFHLFLGGPEPPDPFPEPGNDPTFLDQLEC